MRAYYFDNIPGDQRLAHDSGNAVSEETLNSINVLYWHIPIDAADAWEARIDEVAKEREYKNRDIVHVTKEALGEDKMKMFFVEWVSRSGGLLMS